MTASTEEIDRACPEQRRRARAEIRARREAMLRERIRALHAVNRLPNKQIAAEVGVSTGYVEEVLSA